jgi:hypothetical protein
VVEFMAALAARAFAWRVDNPFGRCTTARVAAFGSTRRDAVRRIKASGLRVDRHTTSRFVELDDEDLALIIHDPQAIWIMDDESGAPWMTVEGLRGARS